MSWVNLEPITQSEVSQKEEKQISSINTYLWNLERQYWRSYLQGSKVDTDILDLGKGESGMIEENSFETYILPYVK